MPPGCLVVVGMPSRLTGRASRPSRMSGSWRPSQISGSGWESLSNVREWSEDAAERPGVVGGPPGCPGVVGTHCRTSRSGGRPSRISRSCRETLSDVREALSNVWECSEGPPGCPGGFSDHSRTSVRASRTHPVIQEGLPDIHEGFPTTLGHPRGPPDHSRISTRSSGHPGGPPTTPGHPGGSAKH